MRALEGLTSLAYPFVIYFGLRVLSPRALAGMLGTLLILRGAMRLRRVSWALLSPVATAGALVLGVMLLAALFDDGRFFTLAPAVVNLALLAVFARSLVRGPSLVESLARLRHPVLPPEGEAYCRRLTVLWCVFFVLNAAFIVWLAVAVSLAAWTLYTGFVGYLVIGLLLGLEHVYRAWRFRRYDDSLADLVLRRIFPPRPAG